jgi:hypothetical protein
MYTFSIILRLWAHHDASIQICDKGVLQNFGYLIAQYSMMMLQVSWYITPYTVA